MHVNLDIINSEKYFEQTGRSIDWEEDGSGEISEEQAEALQKILTTECSIHILRRVTGLCGSLVDDMVLIRRRYIDEYEEEYETYILYREFS